MKGTFKLFLKGLSFYVIAVCCYLLGSRGGFSTRDFGFLGLTLVYGGLTLSYGFGSKMLVQTAVTQAHEEADEELAKKRKKYPGAVDHSTQLPGAPSWDKPLRILYYVLMFGVLYFAAGMSYQEDAKPDRLFYVGLIVIFLSIMVRSQSLRAQPFLDPMESLDPEYILPMQAKGVYGAVRHPAQAAALLLALGSMCAAYSVPVLITGAAVIIVTLIRTEKEDRFLHNTIPGYARYEKEVQKKALPHLF